MDLIAPIAALMAMAWALPWALGRALPEGVGWLLANGALSTLLLAGASAAGFWWLYGEAGDAVLRAAPWHFATLAARSALIWAPVMVLSLANLPRGWTRARW